MALVSKPFADIITFTRASTATYFDATGTLQSAAIDAPRFDYDPATLAARGFLIEESRTNSIRNNTMQGAVAGTPGTLPTNWQRFISGTAATSVVGTGTESGIAYVDVAFSGGNTDGISLFVDGITGHAALNGQTWTGSSYYRLMAGSFANCTINHVVYEANSSGTPLASSPTILTTVTSAGLATQRVITTRTNNNASTAEEQLAIVIVGTGAFSFTLRIGLPQLELGAFATSVIPTTTTALTRSADVASVNTLSPWFNATEGTLFAEYVAAPVTSGQFPSVVALRLNSPNNSQNTAQTFATGTTTALSNGLVRVANVDQFVRTSSGVAFGSTIKSALAMQTDNFAFYINGAMVGPVDILGSLITFENLQIGTESGGVRLNSHIRRITYYPRRLSNAELQAITA